MTPSASVVICAFADEREKLTIRAVEAVLAQQPAPAEVIVVVDHNEALGDQLRGRLPESVIVAANSGDKGLSSARNTAIALAQAEVIAFLDDDAVPRAGWLATLLAAFVEGDVVGVGGKAVPAWQDHQPPWFPNTYLWVVGCSYEGQPETGAVRNPIGCNMAFRRELFERAGVFDTQIGRLGSRPLGCEETELCIRTARVMPGTRFVLVKGAEIDHWVPQIRGRWGYFVRRCYYEGISKALVRTLGDTRSLDTERTYVSRALPSEALRSLRAVLRGNAPLAAGGRIAAILIGLLAAGTGYLGGAVMFRDNPQAPLSANAE